MAATAALQSSSSSSSMPQSSSSSSSSALGPPPPPPPKILLAKPASGPAVPKFARGGGGDDESVVLRSRLPSFGSLNLLSDSWDFHTDRVLPFLTENTDFTVISVIGPTGAGKSTIMNELYGFDENSPGMLPPFATQTEETRVMARHCTSGIELRISSERLILLDTQPVFSPSILAEMIRPDGSSSVSVLNGEFLSADLAYELMCIQLGVFLASISHVLLVVSEGFHDINLWQLMLTVDLLKHEIPDPSLVTPSHSQSSNADQDKKYKDNLLGTEDYLATPIFIHTKLRDEYLSPHSTMQMEQALSQYLSTSSFSGTGYQSMTKSPDTTTQDLSLGPKLFLLPKKGQDDPQRLQYGSYFSLMEQLRNQILAMNGQSFAKIISERDWLRNSARIWELVKKSPVIADYCGTLQSSGLFRR